uniref:Ovule protein n=1 Tax=Toxocara canis TaxID=6265 RepID=A0A183VDG0_TOXCA
LLEFRARNSYCLLLPDISCGPNFSKIFCQHLEIGSKLSRKKSGQCSLRIKEALLALKLDAAYELL